ncbi:metal ABC transporter solute-binding protein, Zn/Mn family [Alteribacillus sp. JSM 102045]|uniref:metal ABC transporter solute-binding protein, Zn/Mn family n=1 Tax=Alteribacillus sp. JSM 102045 TaxID=1562101 RepID=UPI0035BEF966
MNKVFLIFIGSLLSLLFMSACGEGTNQNVSADNPVKVVTTTAQIGDIAENIGGENVEVESLMGPGVDPHLYQASQQDIKKLADADIVFYNGHNLEGNLQEIFEEINDKTPAYAVAENVPENQLISEEGSSSTDPHLWFDPKRWTYAVEGVRDGLIELDEENESLYTDHASEYIYMLDELDTFAKEKISSIPEESRVLVTAHDAFGYFGDAYDFKVEGLQGLSTDAEYSVRDVNNLVDLLEDQNIKAVFIESSVSERAINAVIEGAAKREHEVEIGGELYSDAMGEEDTEEGTYEGMFRYNINKIVSSLK